MTLVAKEVKKVTVWRNGTEIQVRPKGWNPGANTMGYYTFDDQNANQITDFSGNNRNLTGGTMPTYTLVSGNNYAGNYANTSSSIGQEYSYGSMNGDYTILLWVKPTANTASYVNIFHASQSGTGLHQISLIRGYNSGQFEYFDDLRSGTTKRTSIKTGASLNTWYLIGYTRNGTSVKTYCDGVNTNSITGQASTYQKIFYLGSANVGGRFPGEIGDCVIESKTRTAQEVLDFYNQTKGKYGL